MSAIAFAPTKKHTKKLTEVWSNSGELDVFEAAGYFSGGCAVAENAGRGSRMATFSHSHRIVKEEKIGWMAARKSLDLPIRNPLIYKAQSFEKSNSKEKKSKQPISPGGRLASFLNSLFNQSSSKKKSKSTPQSMKEDEESPGRRRRRRSSISLFQGFNCSTNSKSLYSSSNSGFRTPPQSSLTPTTPCKALPKCNIGQLKPMPLFIKNDIENLKPKVAFVEKKGLSDGVLDGRSEGNGPLEKDSIWGDVFSSKQKGFRKEVSAEESMGSDTSSDLFELQNYDFSNGLPVYETTHVDSIKRVASIAKG